MRRSRNNNRARAPRIDTKFSPSQARTLAGQWTPPWTLVDHACEVVADRRARLKALPIGVQLKLAAAVSSPKR